MEDTTKLNTSKLGTKAYWDDFYALEKENFKKNPEDTGECWFDDSNAETRMVEFLSENLGSYKIQLDSSMIDLGTGNGHLLFELCGDGFNGPLHGIDYSAESIQFASEVANAKGYDGNTTFSIADIFRPDWTPGTFDVVLDKGTLDAISLSGMKFDHGRSVVDIYSGVIEKLLEKDGVFLITSCNFTEEELIKIVQSDSLKVWETIKYPAFRFGGVKGTAICSVAFVKQ